MKNTKSLVGKFSGLSSEQQSNFLAKLKKKSISKKQSSLEGSISRVPQDKLSKGVPLSYSQQRLWFIDQVGESEKASYNIPIAVALIGKLNLESVQRALKSIIERHDILRCRIVVEGGQPLQVVVPEVRFTLPVSVVTKEQLDTVLQNQAKVPFDLGKGALFRAEMFKLSDEEHVLFVNMHHIISDGWSLEILKKEFIHYYESEGQLPALDVQYPDFASWQRDIDESEQFKEDLQYWEKSLHGLPECLVLPTLHERPEILGDKGAIHCDALPLGTLQTVEEFSRSNQVSTFVTLMSAFNVLLSRYTNTSDIAVGTPVANRHHKQIERNIGLFVNTIVIRNQVALSSSFSELIQKVNKVVRASYEHQKVPFERVVEHLKPSRSKSYTPLFQVMLVYQDFPSSIQLNIDGLSMTEIPISSSTSKLDLTLYVQKETTGFNLRAEYNSALFDKADIDQLVTHYKQLLVTLCCKPTARIESLPLLTDHECAQLSQLQGKQCNKYKEHTLLSLILEQVRSQPSAIAVREGSFSISYSQLYEHALGVAQQLKSTNLPSNSIIALSISSTWQQISAALGALISGLTYVPLDASQPLKRQNSLLLASGADIILSDTLEQFECIPCIRLDALRHDNTISTMPKGESNELACVVFEAVDQQPMPTGMAITQSSIVSTVLDINERLAITKEDCLLTTSKNDTERSLFERFGILVAGGCIVALNDEYINSPAAWFNLLVKHNVTVWHSSSYSIETLLNYIQETCVTERTSLSKICIAQQNVNSVLLQRISDWDDKLSIYCFEGVPEAGTFSVVSRYTSTSVENAQSVLSNQKLHVLDSALNVCPSLVSGQVYRSGVSLAASYWYQGDKPSARFVTHPETGERLFSSGELGRRLPCGTVEILQKDKGRRSFQGRTISLNEITHALKSHSYVVNAKVEIAFHKSLGDVLIAKVATDKAIVKPDLYLYLQQILPAYLIPRYYDIGNVIKGDAINDYSEQSLSRLQVSEPYVAARNTLEIQLTRIWQKVLGMTHIGVKDCFTELGGTSLQAIQIVNEINDTLDIKVTLKDLFSCASISELADKHSRAE